jgi:hypothetical protein
MMEPTVSDLTSVADLVCIGYENQSLQDDLVCQRAKRLGVCILANVAFILSARKQIVRFGIFQHSK